MQSFPPNHEFSICGQATDNILSHIFFQKFTVFHLCDLHAAFQEYVLIFISAHYIIPDHVMCVSFANVEMPTHVCVHLH
jgi:hypothetical protein